MKLPNNPKGRPSIDPWGNPRPVLKVGDLIRPSQTAFVVTYVSDVRARAYPLTPTTRTIHVPDVRSAKRGVKVSKEINETGEAIDIAPTSPVEPITLDELTDIEFKRLAQLVESGALASFPGLESGETDERSSGKRGGPNPNPDQQGEEQGAAAGAEGGEGEEQGGQGERGR